MIISGTNVSSMPTPAIRPFTTNSCAQLPPSPTAWNSHVAPRVTGPENSVPSPSCSGTATVVVSSKTHHITARNSRGPATRAVAQRSMRSVTVTRTPSRTSVARPAARSIQAKRSSATANSASSPATSRGSSRGPPRTPSDGGTGRAAGTGASSAWSTAAATPSMPSRRRGSSSTTGTPSSRCRAEADTSIPRRVATSAMVRATTRRCGCSRSWATRYRLRARCAASATTTTTSGRSSAPTSNSEVSASSGECASRL